MIRLVKKFALYLLLLAAAGGIVLFGAYAYGAPNSTVGVAAFRLGYAVFPFTRSYLVFYSPLRRDVAAGYIPAEVDYFLSQRLAKTDSQYEFDAIVNFYCMQAGGRSGDGIFRTDSATRERVADSIVRQLDRDEYFLQSLVFLEEVRLGEFLGKDYVGPRSPNIDLSSREEWETWSQQVAPEVRGSLRKWSKLGITWEEKKAIDPLEGTPVRIYECCG